MKIAIVHEMLVKLGGAEKVVENWTKTYPDAPVFTLMYDEDKVGSVFPKDKIHPQVWSLKTQKLYNLIKKQRFSLPFMIGAIESLDFSQYDVLLVSSSGFAHGVITKPETKTIVYYHSPSRYLWDWTHQYSADIGMGSGIKKHLLSRSLTKIRQWDYIASVRHDVTLANSRNTAQRIKKYYKKDPTVLYPPVETHRFATKITPKKISPYAEYYIILSALTEFKKLDIALKNIRDIPEANLVIIGDGDYRQELQDISQGAKNITFVGAQYGQDLVSLVQGSLGLIFPGEEDFGIVPIEVMAAGKPVFALKKGGLQETIIPGKTGAFFSQADGSDFAQAFVSFHKQNISKKYSAKDCSQRAQNFDETHFQNSIQEIIESTQEKTHKK